MKHSSSRARKGIARCVICGENEQGSIYILMGGLLQYAGVRLPYLRAYRAKHPLRHP